VIKETTVGDTRPAGLTVEFVTAANLVPAFAAFYGSIDQLKHREFRSAELPFESSTFMLSRHLPLNTVSASRAMKNSVHR